VLSESSEPTNANDLEWPALVHRASPIRLGFARTEGLEFETADFYPRDVVMAGGVSDWVRAVYERPQMWSTRLQLASDSVRVALRVLDR
jgi:hypothetical protein